MKKTAMALCLIVGFVCGIGFSQWETVKAQIVIKGYYTPEDVKDMSKPYSEMYIIGMIDGLLTSRMIDTDKKLHFFYKQFDGMSSEQAPAIVLKHIRENPREWNWPTGATILSAFGCHPFPDDSESKD